MNRANQIKINLWTEVAIVFVTILASLALLVAAMVGIVWWLL